MLGWVGLTYVRRNSAYSERDRDFLGGGGIASCLLRGAARGDACALIHPTPPRRDGLDAFFDRLFNCFFSFDCTEHADSDVSAIADAPPIVSLRIGAHDSLAALPDDKGDVCRSCYDPSRSGEYLV